MTIEFSMNTANDLLLAKDQFPVDLDYAWQWIGYGKKQNATDTLLGIFEEGLDFNLTLERKVQIEGDRKVSRPYTKYSLTVDCFKMLGMMAATDKGREIRRYFLDCERIAKESFNPPIEPESFQSLPLAKELSALKLLMGARRSKQTDIVKRLECLLHMDSEATEEQSNDHYVNFVENFVEFVEGSEAAKTYVTTQEAMEAIAKYFRSISQKMPDHSINQTMKNLRLCLENLHPGIKALQTHENRRKINGIKRTVIVGIRFKSQ